MNGSARVSTPSSSALAATTRCAAAFGSKKRACLVGNELHRDHLPHAAHLADMWVGAETIGQQLLQIAPDLGRLLHQPFALHDVDVDEAERTTDGMARVGEAVHDRAELRRGVLEHVQIFSEITEADTGK